MTYELEREFSEPRPPSPALPTAEPTGSAPAHNPYR